MNAATIIGTAGQVIEGRYPARVVLVDDRRKDKESGEWSSVQMPVRVSAFGRVADALLQAAPGARVAVSGRVTGREYQGKFYLDFMAGEVVVEGTAVQQDQLDDIPF